MKIVFAVSIALDASLVAWLAQNYATANRVIVAAGFLAALTLAGVVVFVNRRAYSCIDQLEEL